MNALAEPKLTKIHSHESMCVADITAIDPLVGTQ